MMTSLILLIGLFLTPEAHDVSMAMFRLSESAEGLQLHINFDREDYVDINGLQGQSIEPLELQDYLNRTTSWVINGTKEAIEVKELSIERDHIQVVCSFEGAPLELKNLKLHNEFLLAIEDQSNVIMLDLNGRTRGFRMHDDRIQITVDYDL
ncbi:MAG: DUF6702 family protein [Bacteroidota bacterium]